jgi:hypothetical protein
VPLIQLFCGSRRPLKRRARSRRAVAPVAGCEEGSRACTRSASRQDDNHAIIITLVSPQGMLMKQRRT